MRRGMVLAEGRQIEAADMGLSGPSQKSGVLGTMAHYIECAERQALSDALLYYPHNLSQAARSLGISRPTLYRMLHKHSLR
jgi:transcriptional regulator of acetoin/glycerol metabolism